MKFIVEVNRKYLVAVEAETLCGAEHVILDRYADEINTYHVISGAMAYDREGMKTDYFMTALESCETISLAELDRRVSEIVAGYEKLEEVQSCRKDIMKRKGELEAEMERIQNEYAELGARYNNLTSKANNIVKDIDGMKAELGA